MRRRLKYRWRMYRPLESYWLLATGPAVWAGGQGAAGTFVNLADGTTSDAFPAHVLVRSDERHREAAAAAASAGGGGGTSDLTAALRTKQQEARERRQREAQQERRQAMLAAVAAAEQQTRGLRRDALRMRPRCCVELLHAARALHVDLVARPELAFLAELALCIELPAGWTLLPPHTAGAAPRYRHSVSGVVTDTHPLEAYAATFRMP